MKDTKFLNVQLKQLKAEEKQQKYHEGKLDIEIHAVAQINKLVF